MRAVDGSGGAVRVVVADGRGLVLAGLARLLRGLQGIRLVGKVRTGRELVALAANRAVDVALVDIDLPCEGDGLSDVIGELRRGPSPPRVLLMSIPPTLDDVNRVLGDGVSGFLLKTAGVAELETALHAAHSGEVFVCPSIFRNVADIYRRQGPPAMLDGTPWEAGDQRLLELIAEGVSSSTLAEQLRIPRDSVHRERTGLMAKLGFGDPAALLAEAVRWGLLSSRE